MKTIIIGIALAGLVILGLGITKYYHNHHLSSPTSQVSTQNSQVPTQNLNGPGKNSLIKNITLFQQNGGRARFSPDGQTIVFDRKESDGYFQLYLTNLQGQITSSLTKDNSKINHRSNGNAIFDHSGKYLIFISEENNHYLDNSPAVGDSGIGLFSNIWASDLTGSQFWKLTNIPAKQNLGDGIATGAVVNPVISPDGTKLIWTNLYQTTSDSCNGHWGKWQLMEGDFAVVNGVPTLTNQRLAYQPQVTTTPGGWDTGNYVTAMSFLDDHTLIVAGNLTDNKPANQMDQYRLDLNTQQVTDLTNTTNAWEEGSGVTPGGKIIYMSNVDMNNEPSPCQNKLGLISKREFYMMNSDGSGKVRLTYFNDPTASEYMGVPVNVDAVSVSPDGKYMLGLIAKGAALSDVLITFSTPQ